MENLRSIGVFVRAAELQSFAAAAAVLGLTPSAVSKAIATLERSLGVRLLTRTARGVSLTEEGARFHARCRTIVAELQAAERELTGMRSLARGRLRVALHSSPAHSHIVPNLPAFLHRYPGLELDVSIVTGAVSLEAKNFDVAVFLGDPPDSNLVAHRIAERRFRTVAARSYLDRHGTPQEPRDLERHNCLVHVLPTGRAQNIWSYQKGARLVDVKVHGNLSIDDGSRMREMALAGLGIARLPSNNVDPLLATNDDLVWLLADWDSEAPPVHLMYARGRGTAPKVRAFTDFVTSLFKDAEAGLYSAGRGQPRSNWPMWRA
ncbi:LysR family transcriptional regulator [uncultured Piscinibacter sp.]|uniref:LysR family transcriptional regulator n=1 Tax=uncultured Piscinibacter sp. TaxID=1131835 RepID=UPI0026127AC9|nr:LysR family transcriptional regulator [uncultured Piscinibacter sp.]